MITGEIKNKVDKIWLDIYAGGLTNPLTVIEQLTYLMFIRSLDEKDTETEQLENLSGETLPHIFPDTEDGQSMRRSKFKNRVQPCRCAEPRAVCHEYSVSRGPHRAGQAGKGRFPQLSAGDVAVQSVQQQG